MHLEKKPTKKQHYVPQFYLKKFTDLNGFLHIYNTLKNKLLHTRPKDFAYDKYLYEMPYQKPSKTGDEFLLVNYIENIFAKYEIEFADLLNKLDRICLPYQNKNAIICNKQEKTLLYRFIVNLIFRNPYTMNALNLSKIPDEISESEFATEFRKLMDLMGIVDADTIMLAAHKSVMLTEEYENNIIQKYINHLSTLKFIFIYAKTSYFVTSSFPVTIGQDKAIVEKDKTCIYLALSPKLAVLFGNYEALQKHHNRLFKIDDDLVDSFNVEQFKPILGNSRCIISNSKELIENYISKIGK